MSINVVLRRLPLFIRSRRAAWAAALALIALLATFRAFGFHRVTDVDVTTAVVTDGPVIHHIVATGTLQAVTTVQVGAQVSGTIQSIAADYNSNVHPGQVIARIDPALFEAALGQAQATLEEAQAAMMTAEANKSGFETAVNDAAMKLRRAEALSASQLIPRADLDAARIAISEADADLQSGTAQVTVSAAAVQQARAAVDEAHVNLEHTVISSPIDGIVIARNVDVGQTVAAAVQAPVLFEIAADLTRMQVEVDIDEADIAGVQAGEEVSFQVESYPNQTFRGTVASIRVQPVVDQTTSTSPPSVTSSTAAAPAPTASSSTPAVSTPTVAGTLVSYATIVAVSNEDEKLRPGMTATVALTGARRDDTVRIPSRALSFRPAPEVLDAIGERTVAPPPTQTASDSSARRVWRYDGVQFTPVDVRVGLADTDWTELAGGALRPGDAVVTNAVLAKGRGH